MYDQQNVLKEINHSSEIKVLMQENGPCDCIIDLLILMHSSTSSILLMFFVEVEIFFMFTVLYTLCVF